MNICPPAHRPDRLFDLKGRRDCANPGHSGRSCKGRHPRQLHGVGTGLHAHGLQPGDDRIGAETAAPMVSYRDRRLRLGHRVSGFLSGVPPCPVHHRSTARGGLWGNGSLWIRQVERTKKGKLVKKTVIREPLLSKSTAGNPCKSLSINTFAKGNPGAL